ncbi:hypothetical protein IQ266_22430 [filamentous cyanobacterium LEGE 11480]|uniref:Uncharacterized protein n=1 Tax=Romeriopsis navalis LEGE 11480 TaxID=2777977 RepID=A0A928VUW3_9CYAN|nr:ParB/Srx family N-terminal domain-containing protein [Romeriopsis navalis]MBE9032499.1 hypothetical protein [Romeriopsis navalis LEGE 11480]
MLLSTPDSFLGNPLGKILRLPCKFFYGETDAHPLVIQTIANGLKESERNILPIIAQEIDQNEYQVIANAHLLEAARIANLDFVWCMLIDEDMETQLQLEQGDIIKINIHTAAQAELESFFDFLQTQQREFKRIKPNTVANAVINYRKDHTIQSLNFFTKLKCGVGKAKLPSLAKYILL